METNVAKYGKVAVLMGGTSAERDISLKSGKAVFEALKNNGVDAHAIDVGENIIQDLQQGQFDRVFNMLHGRMGEDGVMQGALELLRLPYTGSGVLASALCMDKLRTKEIWLANGLPTPPFHTLDSSSAVDSIKNDLQYPVIVKPIKEGSSIGMSKVANPESLQAAVDLALKYDKKVLVEKWIVGKEFTAAILGSHSLPLIRLETPHDFYDYDAKYFANTTQYHCPCGLDAALEKQLQSLTYKAFQAVGADGWGRVDLMLDEAKNPYLIEVNTLPGMTDHSLVPMAARQAGIDFEALVMKILDTAGLGK